MSSWTDPAGVTAAVTLASSRIATKAPMQEYDFIVVGSGVAGLTAALKAARAWHASPWSPRKRAADSNTAWAQGGIACVQSEEDSFELHVADTLIAGAGLCNEDVVRTIVSEGPARIAELVELGRALRPARGRTGISEFDLAREGGHTQAAHPASPRCDRAGDRRRS